MLTRRHAILTGAALATGAAAAPNSGAGRSDAAVAAELTAAGDPATSDSMLDHGLDNLLDSSLQHVARECLLLAGAAQQCVKSCLGCTDAKTKAFALLCQDVQQICAVTATRICHDRSGSPAICQASADAATRLAVACRTVSLRGLEKFCHTQAQRCASTCRTFVSRHIV